MITTPTAGRSLTLTLTAEGVRTGQHGEPTGPTLDAVSVALIYFVAKITGKAL